MSLNMLFINKKIKRQRKKIMKAFISHNAYNSKNAITLKEIGIDENNDNMAVKAAFTSLIFNRIVGTYEGVFWFNKEEYVKQMTKK